MSLITRAEEFLERSLEDTDYFGWSFTLINPLGETQSDLTGQARHINMLIDIDTGAEVQEEQASVTVRLSSVTIGEPKKNWRVTVTDTAGNEYDCYVVEAMPDRTMGLVILKLGLLKV
jgi:hypothetical protein